MAKILVTGGAGFIGSHLVDRLVELGHDVTVIDDLSTGKRENLNKNAKFIERSITNDLDDIFNEGKFDYVFHLAAQMYVRKSLEDPKYDAEVNIIGSLNIIQNCVKYTIKKIIFSSTGGALYSADQDVPFIEESRIIPESPYGLAKYCIENYMRIIKNTKGLNYVILRYSNAYGPRQDPNSPYALVIPKFITSVLNNKPPVVFGDGEQTRDFIYVNDIVEATIFALNLEGTYNVSSGEETTVNDLANKIKELLNSDLGTVHQDAIKGELRRSVSSSEKLAKKGWKRKYDFNSGLKETIDWFKRY